MHKVMVKLGDRSYPIHLTIDNLDLFGMYYHELKFGKKIAIITNENVASLYLDTVISSLKSNGYRVITVAIGDGENFKTQKSVDQIHDQLIKEQFERDSTIIALGGGVVGDVAGFAAATLLRGIHFIQIPTTLLAQTDSSIGGKVGINHPFGKKHIGSFYQPHFVFCDVKVLDSLDRTEYIAGLAEVIKYGVIWDAEFFSFIEENLDAILKRDLNVLLHIIERCCSIKAEIVSKDEKEEGVRSLLNYGHTFAHAIETVTDYQVYKHGEAVMIGMMLAGKTAVLKGILSQEEFARQNKLIIKLYLPKNVGKLKTKSLLEAMKQDKKIKHGKLRFVLADKIGHTDIFTNIPQQTIVESIEWFLKSGEKKEN